MATYLTASVFRRLAAGHIVHHAGCLSARHGLLRCRHKRITHPSTIVSQRRGFMGLDIFGDGRPLAATKPRLEPGMAKLMEHAKRTRLQARLSMKHAMLTALRLFFSHKHSMKKQNRGKAAWITDHQLELVDKAYTYARDAFPRLMPTCHVMEPFARHALHALFVEIGPFRRPEPWKKDPVRALLAWRLYRDSGKRETLAPLMVSVLCQSGELDRASGFLAGKDPEFEIAEPELLWTPEPVQTLSLDAASAVIAPSDLSQALSTRFTDIMLGYLHANNEQGVLATREAATTGGRMTPKNDIKQNLVMSRFYAAAGAFEEAKRYYLEFSNLRRDNPSSDAPERGLWTFYAEGYRALLDSCLVHGNSVWANELINGILNEPRPPVMYHTVLVWALKSGKSVGEVERMMTILAQKTDFKPSAATYDALMDAALSRKDAYSVERLIANLEKRSLQPTVTSGLLHIEARMTHGDLSGGLEVLKTLGGIREAEADEVDYGRNVANTMNKLICAMCHSRKHSYESIMSLAAELTDEEADFEPETVATLAVLHIARAEMEEAEDLLNTNAARFSAAERDMIIDSIVEHCKDEKTDGGLIWATYEILKKAFDDMNREQRTAIMVQLARKGRGAEAIHVFEQMKLHGRQDTIPTNQTFIDCVTAMGDAGDDGSLGGMYNMLKVDVTIEPDTAIHNAMILATMKCGLPTQALHFWDKIAGSSEGPDIRSIQLALKACATASFGAGKASSIHNQLERAGFALGPVYCGWLLGAFAGQSRLDECFALVEQWQKDKGITPTVDMMAEMFDGAALLDEKDVILKWVQLKYPAIAAQLEKGLREAQSAAEAKVIL